MFNLYKLRNPCIVTIAAIFFVAGCSGEKKKQSDESVAVANQSATQSSASLLSTQQFQEANYCPHVAELVKTNLKWSTKNGKWKSHEESFAKEIEYFKGAQWVGIIVGQVICLYQGKESFDFPIALESTRTLLVLEPQGGAWKQRTPDRKSCSSNNIINCLFTVQKDDPNIDVYEQIRYLKKEPKPNYSKLPL